jgi:hypothetical protein
MTIFEQKNGQSKQVVLENADQDAFDIFAVGFLSPKDNISFDENTLSYFGIMTNFTLGDDKFSYDNYTYWIE